jgi:acetyl esterase/lipase
MANRRKHPVRGTVGLGTFALLAGLGIWAYVRHGEDVAFAFQLLKAYLVSRRFYGSYEHLACDVAFDPEMATRLDVYSPPTGTAHPVLVFVHGGAWKDYHKELFAPLAMKLLPEEMVVVIPDYTLYPHAGYEQMAGEMAAAVSWTLERIDRYGGDPQRVILAGHSSGAHLAGLVMTDPRFLAAHGHSSEEICGLIGMSGVYDVEAEYDYWAARGPSPRLIERVMGGKEQFAVASPIRHVRAGLPPTLLIHGEKDKTVPVRIGIAFDEALRAAGSRSELKIYAGAGHTDFLFQALGADDSRLVSDIAGFVLGCARE